MKRFDTVVFDLDGTLMDTLEDLRTADEYALHGDGNTITLDQVLSCLNHGVEHHMRTAMKITGRYYDLDETIARFREKYSQCYCEKSEPYPGIVSLLEQLHSEGYRLGVCSNKLDEYVKELCEKKLPEGLMGAVRGEIKGLPKKPDPSGLLEVLSQLGCEDASRAVFVGDTEVDVETAKNAGAFSVAVSWGYRPVDMLGGADAVANSASDIYSILNSEE